MIRASESNAWRRGSQSKSGDDVETTDDVVRATIRPKQNRIVRHNRGQRGFDEALCGVGLNFHDDGSAPIRCRSLRFDQTPQRFLSDGRQQRVVAFDAAPCDRAQHALAIGDDIEKSVLDAAGLEVKSGADVHPRSRSWLTNLASIAERNRPQSN